MLGFGLAMDAFSVSLANGLNEPKMNVKKMLGVAGTFALFQGAMPLIGWFLVTRLTSVFNAIQGFIPWAALLLLVFIGGKMLYEGLTPCECEEGDGDCCCDKSLTFPALLLQGVATSIDALSVGLTISDLGFAEALLESSIIAALTLGICFAGIEIGKRFGTKLADKAAILGGSVLIAIGFKIFFFG
ncbi:MAG: manganese efflux pump [Ruminococcaceae bacterium]|nr:manganese efflux pump [Oscillospiraceae bacterium]